MSTPITWEEPPQSRGSLDKPPVTEKSMKKYENFVAELKERPLTWAVFKRASSPTFSTRLKAAYAGVETTCRRVDTSDGKQRYDIYARWVGEG